MTAADQAALFELSDERDAWLRRVLDAEIRGYDRGREAGYAQGRADEAAARDEDWRLAAAGIARGDPAVLGRRWKLRGEERTRAAFGQPHHADRPVRRVQAAGRTWLGGPPVHYGHACADACYGYAPGPYSPAEAAAVLVRLPGNYGAEIARLQEVAREGAAP